MFGEFNYSVSYVGVVFYFFLFFNKFFVNIFVLVQLVNWFEVIFDYFYNICFENYVDLFYFWFIVVGDQMFIVVQVKKVIEDLFDKLVEGGVVNQMSFVQRLMFYMFELYGLVSVYVMKEKLEGGFI